MTKISVIGSGGWGTAIAVLLASKGFDVKLWSYMKEESENLEKYRENKPFLPGISLPDSITFSSDMEYCIKDADYIVSAVPSKGVKSTFEQISKFINIKKQPIISLSKGLDDESYCRLSEVIESKLGGGQIAVLSGPSHAEEVARCKPTTNVVASKNAKLARTVQDIFMTENFRVYTCDDVAGVEYGGALKNIIALCAGVCDGLELGDNAKAALMTRGMTEISRLGIAMGAERETFFGLTGMGDLIVTCTSMHSRNRRAGILIGQGKSADEAISEVKMVVEGVPAAKAAYHLAKKCGVEMPITSAAYNVLFKNGSAKDAVAKLMTRKKRHESEIIF